MRDAVGYRSEVWASRYPALARIMDSADPAAPEGNVIRGNVSSGGRWLDLDPDVPAGAAEIEGNITTGDPGFIDPARGDYRLRSDSPLLAAGFPQLETDRMGLPR